MTTISESITCPLAPTILDIRQFLCEKLSSNSWYEQQWLETYSRILQHVGEAAVGRCW